MLGAHCPEPLSAHDQGPKGRDPLQAGIDLIPFGIGVMVSGFTSGALADKLGARNMVLFGPLIVVAGLACLMVMDEHTSEAYVGGILFLTGSFRSFFLMFFCLARSCFGSLSHPLGLSVIRLRDWSIPVAKQHGKHALHQAEAPRRRCSHRHAHQYLQVRNFFSFLLSAREFDFLFAGARAHTKTYSNAWLTHSLRFCAAA